MSFYKLVMTSDLNCTAITVGILASAIRLAWVEVTQLEIEFETLASMSALAFLQGWIRDRHPDTAIRSIAGLAFWALLAPGRARIPRLGRCGAGNPPFVGASAFLAAPAILPWAILSCALMLAASAWRSIRRGRRMFAAGFPAAPPLLAAGTIVYLLQIAR